MRHGGTFTDVFAVSDTGEARSRRCRRRRRASTSGSSRASRRSGSSRPRSTTLFHGTTVTTNAVITRTGAPLGARHDPRLPRRARDSPREPRGALRHPLGPAPAARPAPPPARGRRAGRLRGRRWSCRSTSDRSRDVARKIEARGIESVGRLPHQRAHEPGARAARPRDPARGASRACMSSLSTDILPEPPEFERTATTVANAYCAPVLRALHGQPRAAARRSGLPKRHRARDAQRGRDDDDRLREGRRR